MSAPNTEAIVTGGVKLDQDKPRMDLIPALAALEEARVWTFGARKYAEHNWAKGLKFSRIIAAAMRHLNSIQQGEDRDPESGLLHAAHIRCCMAMLIHFVETGASNLDDRLVTAKKDLTTNVVGNILTVNKQP